MKTKHAELNKLRNKLRFVLSIIAVVNGDVYLTYECANIKG